MEKFEAGQFSLAPAEEEAIRAGAKMRGENPDAAVEAARERMLHATARLREKQSEEAIENLERHIENTP